MASNRAPAKFLPAKTPCAPFTDADFPRLEAMKHTACASLFFVIANMAQQPGRTREKYLPPFAASASIFHQIRVIARPRLRGKDCRPDVLESPPFPLLHALARH
jgi:hypothetical protein